MPVNPIDLQTLFLQTEQLGRQQAAIKNGAALHDDIQASIAKKINDEASKTIQRPDNSQMEAEALHDDGHSNSDEGLEQKKNKKKEPEEKTMKTISEPYLGVHLDISG